MGVAGVFPMFSRCFFPSFTVIPNPVHVVINQVSACVFARIPRPARSPTSTTTFATTVSTTRTSNSTASPSCTTSPSSWRTRSFHRSMASPKGAWVGQQVEDELRVPKASPPVQRSTPLVAPQNRILYTISVCTGVATPLEVFVGKPVTRDGLQSRFCATSSEEEAAGGGSSGGTSPLTTMHANRFRSVAVSSGWSRLRPGVVVVVVLVFSSARSEVRAHYPPLHDFA